MIISFTKYRLFFILALWLDVGISFGQQTKVDSLTNLLARAKHDTVRLNLTLEILVVCEYMDNLKYATAGLEIAERVISETEDKHDLARILFKKSKCYDYLSRYYRMTGDFQNVLFFLQKRLNIARKLKSIDEVSSSLRAISNCYFEQSNFPMALKYLENALEFAKTSKDKYGEANCLRLMARFYQDQLNLEEAANSLEKSLVISKLLNDTSNIFSSLIEMGNLFGKMDQIPRSKKCFNDASKIASNFKGNERPFSYLRLYSSMGNTFSDNKNFEEAIKYYEKTLEIAIEINEKTWIRGSLNNIGNMFKNIGKIEKALEYHKEALKVAQETGIEIQVIWCYLSLSRDYWELKKYSDAKFYNDKMLEFFRKQEAISKEDCVSELFASQIDSVLGNYKEAYLHYQKYTLLRDKLKSEEISKMATKEKYQSEYDRKIAIDKVMQDKKDLAAKDELQRQKIVRNSFIVGFSLLMLLVIFVFRSYRQKRKANMALHEKNREIEDKNKEILDSIRYAKRIQNSLLPTNKYIEKALIKNKKE